MIGALQWIQQQAGGSTGGGFLSTHPGTDERIDRLQKLAAANRP
jgi:Zn-dependent protease with chaperone function